MSSTATRRKEGMTTANYKRATNAYDTMPRTVMSMDQTDGNMERAYKRSTSASAAKIGSNELSKVNKIKTDEARKISMKETNSLLVSYIDKVRLLQQATDGPDSAYRKTDIENANIKTITTKFEGELADWKEKYERALSELHRLKIENQNVAEENRQINLRFGEQETMLRDRDATLANLETEIAQLLSKLNLLQNDKGRLEENDHMLKEELARVKAELANVKKGFDKERLKSSELDAKLRSLDQELKFKVQILEEQLVEERKKGHVDLLEKKVREKYESRLKKEIEKLRLLYEEETEKAKKEYMYFHAKELTEMQEALTMERTNNGAAIQELREILEKIKELKAKIESGVIKRPQKRWLKATALEQEKHDLNMAIQQLSQSLKEQSVTFQAQLTAKDKEVGRLLERINLDREENERLLQVNIDLDHEISLYRSVLDSEMKRFRKMSTSAATWEAVEAVEKSSDSSDDEAKRSFANAQDSVDGRTYRTQRSSTTTSYVTKTMARSQF